MTVQSIANQNMQNTMLKLATGKRINNAADDAAGLAIAEKLNAQVRALEQNERNSQDMSNLTKTAEGAMAGGNEALGRMRELSLQAANGTLTDDDRQIIQNEMAAMGQAIATMASDAQFNNNKLLDGSFQNKHTAQWPDGSGTSVSIGDMSPTALGIAGLDVTRTGSTDAAINQLDKAMSSVTSERSKMGAYQNAFESAASANVTASINLQAAKSRMMDTDVAKTASEAAKVQLLNQYEILMQTKKKEQLGMAGSLEPV